MARIITSTNRPSYGQGTEPTTKPPGFQDAKPSISAIYIGKEPAVEDDIRFNSYYNAQSNDIKLGSWNGDSTPMSSPVALKDQSYVAFTGLSKLKVGHKIVEISSGIYTTESAVAGISVLYDDDIWDHPGTYVMGTTIQSAPTLILSDEEKIIKMETKASIPAGETRNRIRGLKLTTDKGKVWKVNDAYDEINDAHVVVEESPKGGWFLKGFYGAESRHFISRLGPIWGH